MIVLYRNKNNFLHNNKTILRLKILKLDFGTGLYGNNNKTILGLKINLLIPKFYCYCQET